MKGIKQKVAIVAGAAPGNIGGATAVRLAEEGAAVLAADLNEAAAQSVVDEVRAFGGKATSQRFDKPRRDSASDSAFIYAAAWMALAVIGLLRVDRSEPRHSAGAL
jgi:NAD(P)-dependent dehydrogenase (short-subunit alcohol dehydrogenase family)